MTSFLIGAGAGSIFWSVVGIRKFNKYYPGPWRRTKERYQKTKKWALGHLFDGVKENRWSTFIYKWWTGPNDRIEEKVREFLRRKT